MNYQIRSSLSFFIFVCIPQLCFVHAKLRMTNIFTNETVERDLYNGLPWYNSVTAQDALKESFNMHSEKKIPVIKIGTAFEKFDPCNAITYNMFTFEPLVAKSYDAMGLNYTMETISSMPWIALVENAISASACDGLPPLSIFYGSYITLSAQRLGAKAVIWAHHSVPQTVKVNIPPNVDIEAKMVHNMYTRIPLLVVKTDEYIGQDQNMLNSFVYPWFVEPSSIEFETNDYDWVYNPFGVYAYIWGSIGVFSLLLSSFTAIHMRSIIDYYSPKQDYASKKALQMRLMILIPEILNGIIRVLVSIDPLGVFYRFDFFLARIFINFSVSLSIFTDVVTIFYCSDVHNIYKASRNMLTAVPFLVKYRKGGSLIITVSFCMIVVDQLVLYFGLLGRLGRSTSVIPVLYLLMTSAIVVIKLFQISAKMQKEVHLTLEGLESMVAENDSKAKSTSSAAAAVQKQRQNIIDRTKSLLKMKRFTVLAAWGRLWIAITLILSGVSLIPPSSYRYAASFILIGSFSCLSSLAQVFAALQLPHNGLIKRMILKTTRSARSSPGAKESRVSPSDHSASNMNKKKFKRSNKQ